MIWLAVFGLVIGTGPGAIPTPAGPPVSLRGSPAAMQQQYQVALDHGLDFFRTEAEIRAAVERGELVELRGSDVYEVADFVDLPYLHPAAAHFVTRTAARYREACGEPLVVTSGVRATTLQPRNAHALSVHPAGMAVDLRVSQNEQCRGWLEAKMLALEEERVINGIREFHPPHYHVAVFPAQYMVFVGESIAEEAAIADVDEAVASARTAGWVVALVTAAVLLLGAALLARRGGRRMPAESRPVAGISARGSGPGRGSRR